MLQNLDVFEADAVIIDLEDSVHHLEKDAARDLVQSFLDKFSQINGKIYIRLNQVDSPHFEADIELLNPLSFDGYVIPKANANNLKQVSSHTNKSLIPIIETPRDVLNALDIADSKNVIGIILGAEDLTKEIGVNRTKDGTEILFARSRVIFAASAAGIEAIDTPYVGKEDLKELRDDAIFAKSIGFTGKAIIHPNHVDLINEVFKPTDQEIKQATRIIKAANKHKKGAFSLDGKMIDLPVIERAKKLLEVAEKYRKK
jgi:citrate lyase subunit beta/citryl-CoA lyase